VLYINNFHCVVFVNKLLNVSISKHVQYKLDEWG